MDGRSCAKKGRTGKTGWVFERREHVRARVCHCVAWDDTVRPQRRPVCDVGARLGGVLLKSEDVHSGVREVFEVEVGVDSNINRDGNDDGVLGEPGW